LSAASFNVRLRWRVGDSWQEIDEEGDAEPADDRDPYEAKMVAMSALAAEACQTPELLSPTLIAWCHTDEARQPASSGTS
jgi:hypothetical protein